MASMNDPIAITVAGALVEQWTEVKIKRSRDELTGSLSFNLFYPSMPSAPVVRSVKSGAEIIAFVGGKVAFTGTIDKRAAKGSGKKPKGDKGGDAGGGSVSSSISKDNYTIEITARGKTKGLITSSHQHPTGEMKSATSAQIMQKLVEPFGVSFQDRSGDSTKIEKARFLDGATVHREIVRWTVEHNLIVNETKEGELQMTKPGKEPRGVDLILGENIISFESSQSEDMLSTEVLVKGQRTSAREHGTAAIQRKLKAKLKTNGVAFRPFTVQLTGDATDDRLKLRAKVEARKRNEDSATITIEVFGVTQENGEPWDFGVVHYCEIPPEGIADDFVVTEVEYTANSEEKATFKTTLTLKPAVKSDSGSRSDAQAAGQARLAKAGFTPDPNLYPDPWQLLPLMFS